MSVVSRKDRDGARLKNDGWQFVVLNDQLARADVMIADEFLGSRIEGREMARREFGRDAEVAAELPIDDHAASEAKRAQDVIQNVHRRRLRSAYVCGVSVKLSGKPVMLANESLSYTLDPSR